MSSINVFNSISGVWVSLVDWMRSSVTQGFKAWKEGALGVRGLHERCPSKAHPVTPLSREVARSPTPAAQVGTFGPWNFVSCGQNQLEEGGT